MTGDGTTRRVALVVDDDADMTRFMGAILATRGVTSVAAYDAVQGLLVAQKHRPNVVLVDWHMPAGGGPQLLRKLRDLPDTRDIPVIVITADSAPNLPVEAAELGARTFLHKPVDPDRLAEVVLAHVPE